MNKVHVLIISGYGTNCEQETAHAARLAGADQTRILHFSALKKRHTDLDDFNFLIFPGGFLDGDQLGAAQAATNRYLYTQTDSGKSLAEWINEFRAKGGLILGICNGFQLLTKLGLLPAVENKYLSRQASLSHNDSARFEDRWVNLKCNSQAPSIFTRNLEYMYLPVRHGEGKMAFLNTAIAEKVHQDNHIAIQYTDEQGEITCEYPDNPNGSPQGIAGLSDSTGQIFGLMPHPEAFNHTTNYPVWTKNRPQILGTAIFENAISHLRSA